MVKTLCVEVYNSMNSKRHTVQLAYQSAVSPFLLAMGTHKALVLAPGDESRRWLSQHVLVISA